MRNLLSRVFVVEVRTDSKDLIVRNEAKGIHVIWWRERKSRNKQNISESYFGGAEGSRKRTKKLSNWTGVFSWNRNACGKRGSGIFKPMESASTHATAASAKGEAFILMIADSSLGRGKHPLFYWKGWKTRIKEMHAQFQIKIILNPEPKNRLKGIMISLPALREQQSCSILLLLPLTQRGKMSAIWILRYNKVNAYSGFLLFTGTGRWDGQTVIFRIEASRSGKLFITPRQRDELSSGTWTPDPSCK